MQDTETLGWSEERLRQLVENVDDYAIFVSDIDGIVEAWNGGAERLFGYTATEMIGQTCDIVFTPEDCARSVPEKERQIARETGSASDERWHLRKDGSRFFSSGFQTALFDNGNLTGYAKIVRDLTERVTLEEQLRALNRDLERKVDERTAQLQEEIAERKNIEELRVGLLRKIVTTQEDERKRISRDLHDHLGQKLTALRLNLETIKLKCSDDALCRHIEEVQKIAEGIDSEVDFLAWELRPALLDELGLERALENFVHEFSRHFEIPSEFHSKGFRGKRLIPEIEINLYRVAQESLNNIAKHAEASMVNVLLDKPNEHLVLIVEDNGKGFDLEEKMNRQVGLGLIGMQERLALIGGSLEIESREGEGTTIFARAPGRFSDEEL